MNYSEIEGEESFSRLTLHAIQKLANKQTNREYNKMIKTLKYDDVYVVDDIDEAEQFRYQHNDEPVEVGTAVGYDIIKQGEIVLTCFEGIYYCPDHV